MSNVGKMAVIPYVDEDWCRHSVQWQMYSFRGSGRGVVKRICEHWQRPSIFFFYDGDKLWMVWLALGTPCISRGVGINIRRTMSATVRSKYGILIIDILHLHTSSCRSSVVCVLKIYGTRYR